METRLGSTAVSAEEGAVAGAVAGAPKLLLRLEGLAVLALCLILFHRLSLGWPLFLILFLAPDLSMLGYLRGPRIGATCYNAVHSYLGPLAVAGLALAGPKALLAVALIWAAHIGLDRLLGFGLKYAAGFGHTHLGRIGRRAGGAS